MRWDVSVNLVASIDSRSVLSGMKWLRGHIGKTLTLIQAVHVGEVGGGVGVSWSDCISLRQQPESRLNL